MDESRITEARTYFQEYVLQLSRSRLGCWSLKAKGDKCTAYHLVQVLGRDSKIMIPNSGFFPLYLLISKDL